MPGESLTYERPLGDARYFQIAALGCLLALNVTLIEFGARPLPSAVAIGSALLAQWACVRLTGLSEFDFRSPLITGLSLSLLLRADAICLYGGSGDRNRFQIFVSRKRQAYLESGGLRHRGAAAGIRGVWISPGQWGAEIWFATLTGCLAIFVLSAARRADIAIFFRQSRSAAAGARVLARRSRGDSNSSVAERLAADLHVLHDFGSSHRAVALPPDTQPLSRADIRPFHGQHASPPFDFYPHTLPPGGTLALAPRVEAVDGVGSRLTSNDLATVNDSYPDRPASVLRPVVVTANVDRYPLGVTALPTRRIRLLGGRVIAKIVSLIWLTGAVLAPQPADLFGKAVPRVRFAQVHHDRDGQHQYGQ